MTTPVLNRLAPVEITAPALNPSLPGLYAVATPVDQADPIRWLDSGIQIRPFNVGPAHGTWEVAPCANPGADDLKSGEREPMGEPFDPLVIWAYDECDPTDSAEIRRRAEQLLRLQESITVERDFAARLQIDDGNPQTASDIVAAVGALEEAFGLLGFNGVIHAAPRWAAVAAQANLIVRTGAQLRTPLGHLWAFGGGYGPTLGNTLVGTSPVLIYRSDTAIREALDPNINRRIAVAERAVVVGYEKLVDSFTITG